MTVTVLSTTYNFFHELVKILWDTDHLSIVFEGFDKYFADWTIGSHTTPLDKAY